MPASVDMNERENEETKRETGGRRGKREERSFGLEQREESRRPHVIEYP